MKTKTIKEFSIHDKNGIVVEIDSNEDMILGLYRFGSKTQEALDITEDLTIYGVFIDKSDFAIIKDGITDYENYIKKMLSNYDFGIFYLKSDEAEICIRHEISHALFKYDYFYQKQSMKAFSALSLEIQERVKDRLNTYGYTFETEEQMVNEAIAHIVENSSRLVTNNKSLKNIYKILDKFC